MTVRLHQFARAWGLPNASPFCMKVETYLRMAGIPYESVLAMNPGKLPKGKAPVLEDEGRLIPDSTFILKYLEQKYRPGLGDALDARERGIAHAYARMLEERYYWALVYFRWIDEQLWPQVRETFFGGLPGPVRALISRIARRDVKSSLHGHGLGRHSRDEIIELGRADLESVAAFLGDKPYFMGDSPTSVDAVVYAMLANTLCVPLDSPLRETAASHPAFAAYCERMRRRYFPEEKIGRSWSPPAETTDPPLRSVG